jgi:pyruvate-formate lyase-activating enzyme
VGDDTLRLVVADGGGNIIDVPGIAAAARSGDVMMPLRRPECTPLPRGSELFQLPGRMPVGYDEENGEPVCIDDDEITAVAAFLAPAHTQLLLPPWEIREGAQRLPLFAYTAVGWHRGRFYVPARRVDPDRRQDIDQFPAAEIARRARALRKKHRKNRLWQHLLDCALCSGCPAARNLVLGRWEAPLPTSRSCNSRCLGCLSLQPTRSGCPATQERIAFRPTVDEILEIAVPHLEKAPRPVVSFGQGCEGEPLSEAKLIEEAIRAIRARTRKGTINLNTNASRPAALERLFAAGLDSIRVSLNSARPEVYAAYFRPRKYGFGDVRASLAAARKAGRFASLNYFVFPGVTDDPAEVNAFEKMLKTYKPGLIQWRNLNIDPDWYWEEAAAFATGEGIGIGTVMDRIRRKFPRIRFGYFNPPLRGRRAYGPTTPSP